MSELEGPSERESALAEAREQMDLDRIAKAVREILAAVGEDPDREGLRETPGRVARMYAELFQGLHQDPADHLKKFFTEQYDAVIAPHLFFQGACASTTCCHSTAKPTSPTCREAA